SSSGARYHPPESRLPGATQRRRPRPSKRLGGTRTVARQHLRSRANGRDDLRVRGAATEVAAHPFAYLGQVVRVALGDASDGRHDLTGAAEPALKSVVV